MNDKKTRLSLLGDASTLVIAASDATARIRANAHYVCDGTDDDIQIQAAIDALPSLGGSIYLLGGLFSLGDTIVINGVDNIHLGGMGDATVLKLADSLSVDTALRVVNSNKIIIEKIKIDSNGSNQIGGSARNILLDQAQNIIVSQVTLTNAKTHALEILNSSGSPCQDIIIINCNIDEFDTDDASNDGISISDDQFNITIRSCIISHTAHGSGARSGIEIEDGAHDVAITGCIIYGMQNGVNMQVHAGEPAVYAVTVQACTIYDTITGLRLNGRTGVLIYAATLSDNVVHSNTTGMDLTRVRCTIIGNVLFSNTGYGISTYQCDYCTISSCWVWANGEGGIALNQSDLIIISDSIIFENIKDGIILYGSTTGCNRCIFSNNQIIDNDDGNTNNYDGISVGAASHNNLFQGNIFYVSTGGTKQVYGIDITAGATGNIIVDNQMTQGGRTGPLRDAGTSTVIRENIGYVTENEGAAANINDGGTIAHGLASTPTIAIVSPSVASEMVSVTGLGAVNITVAIKKDDGTPGTQQTIYWRASL